MKNSVLSVFILFLSLSVFSQKIIRGNVTAFGDVPLEKVKIIASKSKKVVYTDSLGRFEIPISKKQKLRFIADGFFDYEQKIKSSKNENLEINLIYDENDKTSLRKASSLHLKKEVLKYYLTNYPNTNSKYQNLEDVFDVIQFEYPIAKVINVRGIDQILLTNRGVNSLFSDIHALLVVDGIVTNDISNINPFDVKKVKVLQGHEAGYWGIRGSNGVVKIDLRYGP